MRSSQIHPTLPEYLEAGGGFRCPLWLIRFLDCCSFGLWLDFLPKLIVLGCEIPRVTQLN